MKNDKKNRNIYFVQFIFWLFWISFNLRSLFGGKIFGKKHFQKVFKRFLKELVYNKKNDEKWSVF